MICSLRLVRSVGSSHLRVAHRGSSRKNVNCWAPPGSPEQNARDPFLIVDKVPLSQMPLIYIACGGQDFLLEETRTFVDLLSKKKIPYEYREISLADHNYDFWDEQVSVFLDILMTKPGFTR
jgi:S-formylglutathione hydrolase FrmB